MPVDPEVEHKIVYRCKEDKWMANCSCGAEWSHPLRVTDKEMDDIAGAHRAYFNKPKMTTL